MNFNQCKGHTNAKAKTFEHSDIGTSSLADKILNDAATFHEKFQGVSSKPPTVSKLQSGLIVMSAMLMVFCYLCGGYTLHYGCDKGTNVLMARWHGSIGMYDANSIKLDNEDNMVIVEMIEKLPESHYETDVLPVCKIEVNIDDIGSFLKMIKQSGGLLKHVIKSVDDAVGYEPKATEPDTGKIGMPFVQIKSSGLFREVLGGAIVGNEVKKIKDVSIANHDGDYKNIEGIEVSDEESMKNSNAAYSSFLCLVRFILCKAKGKLRGFTVNVLDGILSNKEKVCSAEMLADQYDYGKGKVEGLNEGDGFALEEVEVLNVSHNGLGIYKGKETAKIQIETLMSGWSPVWDSPLIVNYSIQLLMALTLALSVVAAMWRKQYCHYYFGLLLVSTALVIKLLDSNDLSNRGNHALSGETDLVDSIISSKRLGLDGFTFPHYVLGLGCTLFSFIGVKGLSTVYFVIGNTFSPFIVMSKAILSPSCHLASEVNQIAEAPASQRPTNANVTSLRLSITEGFWLRRRPMASMMLVVMCLLGDAEALRHGHNKDSMQKVTEDRSRWWWDREAWWNANAGTNGGDEKVIATGATNQLFKTDHVSGSSKADDRTLLGNYGEPYGNDIGRAGIMGDGFEETLEVGDREEIIRVNELAKLRSKRMVQSKDMGKKFSANDLEHGGTERSLDEALFEDTIANSNASRQSSRHLQFQHWHGCDGSVKYSFKRYCEQRWDGWDGCNQPQGVRIGCYAQYGGGTEDIIFGSSRQEISWYCSSSKERFDADRDWNRVRWSRSGRNIHWYTYFCDDIETLTGSTEHYHLVTLKSGSNCLSLPEHEDSYGVEEALTNKACNDESSYQDFYLEPLESNKKYRLHTYNSANRKLAICAASKSGGGFETHHCSKISDTLTIDFDSTEGTFVSYNIMPKGTKPLPPFSSSNPPTEVQLFNAVPGGMKYLRLEPQNIFGYNVAEPPEESQAEMHGKIHFKDYDYDSGTTSFTDQSIPTRFYISRVPTSSSDEFVLRPKGSYRGNVNACIMARDPLTLKDCDSGNVVTWKVRKGQVVSTTDETLCITHQLNTEKGVTQRCTPDANSYVSIIPIGDWRTTKFEQVRGIFPASGIQLSGNDKFSSIILRPDHTNQGLEMSQSFVIEFKFVLGSAVGTSHKVCLLFSNTDMTKAHCFKLAGSVQNKVRTVNAEYAKAEFTNEYIIQPTAYIEDSDLRSRNIEHIKFVQEGDLSTQSTFFSIESYDMVMINVVGRRDVSLTLELIFPQGTLNTADLHFLPTVLVQDAEGSYQTSVPNAEKLIQMDQTNNQVIISGLIPGRRFLIRLNPVRSTEDSFADGRRTLKALFYEYTACSCDLTEETGKPQRLTVDQSGGKISMQFTDYSVCEDAYAFTRQLVDGAENDLIAYAPNYFFYSTKPCSEEKIEPGGDFSDRVSNLVVGSTYEYCSSAVSNQYMVNSTEADGSFTRASSPTCFQHEVKWEANVIIEVTLKKDAGSLPVNNVIIDWELRDPDGTVVASDTGPTLNNGQFVIAINQRGLDSGVLYPLHVRPTKDTGDVAHNFLCDDEDQDCSMDIPVGYLTHLHFGKVIRIADKTSVPIRGKVDIRLPDYDMVGDTCPSSPVIPLRGATVCLVRKSTSSDGDIPLSTCVDTESDGTYELPATFGTLVYPSVTYENHEFQYMRNYGNFPQPTEPINATGFLISESGYENFDYEGHNFRDITTAEMIIEVAGGLCNIPLGQATLQVRFVSKSECMWEISQDGYKKIYTMPAHKLSVYVENLEADGSSSRSNHLNYLQNSVSTQIVDLTDVESPSNSTSDNSTQRYDTGTGQAQQEAQNISSTSDSAIKQEETAAENLRTARFQYNGDVLIFPEIESGKDQLGASCGSLKRREIVGQPSESTHVVRTGVLFELAIVVRQEIFREEKVYCDNLGSDDSVSLTNNVGLQASDNDDHDILILLEKGGTDVSNYKRCTTGCSLPILPPKESFEKSYAAVLLQAGMPNPTGDFLKYMNIRYGATLHTMEVFVTGDKSTGGVPFSMPTHFPLLVIRDPPGGSSSASYENMQHSASITMETYEKYQGIDAGISAQVSLMEKNMELCGGVGVAMMCDGSAETDNYITPSVEASGNFLSDYKDDSYTHGFSVTWSYTTSDEIENAGKASDMILVPVVTIKHTDTRTVFWDETNCVAYMEESTKIDLSSPENQRAFSVITTNHARTVEIPRLEKVIRLLNSTAAADPGNITATDEFLVTHASYLSWKEFLRDYDATSQGDDLLNVGEWFNWFTDNRIKPKCVMQTQTWNCTSTDGVNSTRKTTAEYRCDPEEPNILSSSFNTKDLEWYLNQTSQPKCPNSFYGGGVENPTCSECTQVTNAVSSDWVDLPDSHEYWDKWNFYHPIPDKPQSGLAPNTLLKNAETNTETENLAQKLTKSSLESTGRIIFSGGGGEFSMTLGSDHLKSIIEKYNGRADIGDFDNVQQEFSAGLEGNVGGKVFGLGLQVNAHAAYHYSIDHKVLSANEIEGETSVSFALSDPDVDDEFHVDILFDPKYGTFVFRTVGGQSKCPHEVGTSKAENPKITQIWPPGPNILPDDDMIFEVLIQNDGLGDSIFDLYAEAIDIEGGLGVDMLDSFVLESTIINPNATTRTTVTVSRGPKMYSYNPVRIALRSGCENRARARSADGSSATIDFDLLYNVGATTDKKIEFLQPCPEIWIVGNLKQDGYFNINESSEADILVQVFNPIFSTWGNFTSMKRGSDALVENIILKYRRVGHRQWSRGQHEQDGAYVDIYFEEQEDSYGYSEVDWYVELLPDAHYEIQVSISCGYDSSLPDAMTSFSTEIFPVRIDRVKPSIMGYPDPQNNLIPGDDLVVEFTEEIWCDVPFDVSMNVSGVMGKFELSTSSLKVVCSSNILEIQVAKDISDEEGYYDNLLGRNYILTISGVKDLNGNVMEDFVYSSHFICLPPVPKLSVRHTAGNSEPYLPNEKVLFEITLGNEARALSYLELGVDPRSNTDNLEIHVNGESIAISHNYILGTNETATTVVSVGKGPGKKLRFNPIVIFLRSACDEDSNNPVEVTAELWNHEDLNGKHSLLFEHPCPSIRWAGQMHQFSHLMFNNDALSELNSLVKVSIFNEDYINHKLFDRSVHNTALTEWSEKRLEDIVLLYRRVGVWNSSKWELGQLKHPIPGTSMIDGRMSDFSMESIENKFGYSTLSWDVQLLDDSTYEVKVMSRCSPLPQSHDELNNFSTEIVHVAIDRDPPRVYGVPSLQLPNNFHPSDEFVIPFTEEIYCEQPYTFNLTLILDSGSHISMLSNGDGLHVKCEGKNIRYRFDAVDMNDYSLLVNSNITVELEGVEDRARNQMAYNYNTSYIQCNQTLSGIRLYVGMGCDRFDNDCDLLVDECDEDLIAPTMAVPSLLKVRTDMSDPHVPVHLLRGPVCFSNILDARQFLLANIDVYDDCSHEVRLEVEYVIEMSRDGLAVFRATATDERCEGSNGNHFHSEIFKVEIFDGFDTQGLLSDNTVVRGMGCDRADQNCNGIVDDCDEDLVSPVIYMSEGVTLTELQNHMSKEFVSSHCFNTFADVAIFLDKNVYAEDDCAENVTIDIAQVATSHTWEKNHKYNLAEYLVTATDSRCGEGEHWSVSKTFLVEVFAEYDQDVRQQGCNGFDENCDGVVDDCSEDRTPPVISFKDALTVAAFEGDDGLTIINNPAFATLKEAQEYLMSVVKAEDDCARELFIAVRSPPWAECHNTIFTVTVIDPRCSDINPLQTVSRDFALKVDNTAPSVSVGFDRTPNQFYDENDLYLHVDEAELRVDYVNTLFWYNVQDNCPQQTRVEVSVASNEFAYSKQHTGEMVLIEERKNEVRQSHKLQIFVQPEMCIREPVTGYNHQKPLCDWDPDTALVRFYEIDVTVTDYAGNQANAQASVIVLQEGYRQIFDSVPEFRTRNFFIDMIKRTPPHNFIKTHQFHWEIFADQGQSLISTSIRTTRNTTVLVSSTFMATSIPVVTTDEDTEAVKIVLENSVRDILERNLDPNETILEVTILSIGGQALQRKLQIGAGTPIEYMFGVVDVCTQNCIESDKDVGTNLLEKLKKTIQMEVSEGGISDAIKKNAKKDQVIMLMDMSVVSTETIKGNFTSKTAPTLSFKVPGRLSLVATSDLSEINQKQIEAALIEVITKSGCPSSVVEGCSVSLISMDIQSLSNGLIRRSRQLQDSFSWSWDFVYDILIDMLCDMDNCSKSKAVANVISDQITSDLRDAYNSGELIEYIQAVTEVSLTKVADTVPSSSNAGIAEDTDMQDSIIYGWYPDQGGDSGQCKNDTNAPLYMRGNTESWFRESLAECCNLHYADAYPTCIGNAVDWFPNWNLAGSGHGSEKCLNDADLLPDYMHQHQFSSLETCCREFYQWDIGKCVTQSGGKTSESASMKWFVDWRNNVCKQSCLEGTGQDQAGAAGLHCGGIAPRTADLWPTIEACCKAELKNLSLDSCVAGSTPPNAAVGTTKWYVSYFNSRCVQDCAETITRPTCGGVVEESHIDMFITPVDCCAQKLGWIKSKTCLAESTSL